MVGVTISPNSKPTDGSTGGQPKPLGSFDKVKKMASDGTRWITGLGMSKSIVQGEISVGGRYFDMEKEMANANAALSAMQKESNQLGKMALQPTLGELMVVSENHRKQRVYKDKNFGTWLYLEIESCQGLGKADR